MAQEISQFDNLIFHRGWKHGLPVWRVSTQGTDDFGFGVSLLSAVADLEREIGRELSLKLDDRFYALKAKEARA